MDAATRERVRARAGNICEYCRLSEEFEPLSFHVEHVVARQHGGEDLFQNLALACHQCNLHKGSSLASFDPVSGILTPLFNPRTQVWNEHFRSVEDEVLGLTPIGRTSVQVLAMNADGRRELRRR